MARPDRNRLCSSCAVHFLRPHAWMRPYYEAIASREGFSHLAPSHQFELLVEAVAKD